MESLGHLCESLSRDETLLEVLSEAGVTAEQWHTLDTAVTTGTHLPDAAELVDLIIATAENLGVDIAGHIREYHPLPMGGTGLLSVRGWVCPHRRLCNRADFTSPRTPTCGITGTPLGVAEGTAV